MILWRPQRDLNPCRWRERPVSLARLDDGDKKLRQFLTAGGFGFPQPVGGQPGIEPGYPAFLQASFHIRRALFPRFF